MFHISAEELESLKKQRNENFMLQVLKQAAQLKQSQPQEFKIPRCKLHIHLSAHIQVKICWGPFLTADPNQTTVETSDQLLKNYIQISKFKTRHRKFCPHWKKASRSSA